MADATSISFSKFVASVQSAVKAAVAQHPKFKMDAPNAITISYLIRGIPVPDGILASVTLAETQAFANDIATHVASAVPGAVAAAAPAQGAILGLGRHVIVGIPPVTQTVQLEK
ncbi:MAG TPA: hypothetical protein VMS37_24025 [Verrucomicrobiae bacterium]|nr:hypothetical protein [Verrucomicrobiae bacterium]